MTILQLHKPKPCDNVVDGLRRLVDEIEAGEFDWPVTTCIVALGHTGAESAPDSDGLCYQEANWQTRGYGPRTDRFTSIGLLSTIITDWNSPE